MLKTKEYNLTLWDKRYHWSKIYHSQCLK